MTTEITTPNAPETATPNATPAPADKRRTRTRKQTTPDFVPGNYKLDTKFFTQFPELQTLAERLSSYGYLNFKFDFSYAPADKPNKKLVFVSKFNAPADYIGTHRNFKLGKLTAPAQITVPTFFNVNGTAYHKSFPEIHKLTQRLNKLNFSHYRINISYAHSERPAKRVETQIWTNGNVKKYL